MFCHEDERKGGLSVQWIRLQNETIVTVIQLRVRLFVIP